MRPIWLLLVLAPWVPAASAAPTVTLELEPREDTQVAVPGQELYLEYTWEVTWTDTVCETGTEFGVDFFPEGPDPRVGGASFVPGSAVAAYPDERRGTTILEVYVADDAPARAETFTLATKLATHYAGQCAPQPQADARASTLTLQIESPATTTTITYDDGGDGADGGGTPGPGLLAVLAAVGAALVRRRR